ncbi:MAG TPA: UvrB/UvrC motif-containing protein [archaeon]|nr:UvrB/UvrC motif-containing protein [archaeon]
MKCERCKKNEAVIHFTQIKDGNVVSYNLCKECAGKYGVKTVKLDSQQQPVFTPEAKSEVLSELVEAKDSDTPEECPFCHSKLDDIKRTGRLGCGNCFETFEKQIDVLLRRIQGSSFHVGERSVKPEGQKYSDQLRIRELKKELNAAVKVEDYEKAARLRDEIISIEKRLEVSK